MFEEKTPFFEELSSELVWIGTSLGFVFSIVVFYTDSSRILGFELLGLYFITMACISKAVRMLRYKKPVFETQVRSLNIGAAVIFSTALVLNVSRIPTILAQIR